MVDGEIKKTKSILLENYSSYREWCKNNLLADSRDNEMDITRWYIDGYLVTSLSSLLFLVLLN